MCYVVPPPPIAAAAAASTTPPPSRRYRRYRCHRCHRHRLTDIAFHRLLTLPLSLSPSLSLPLSPSGFCVLCVVRIANLEEQGMEAEALESIFMDDFELVRLPEGDHRRATVAIMTMTMNTTTTHPTHHPPPTTRHR